MSATSTKETDPGTGPAHVAGSPKGEDLAKGRSDEDLKDERRSDVAESKPIADESPDQA